MQSCRMPVLLSCALLSCLVGSRPVQAQEAKETNNDTLAAAVKAAVFVPGRATVPVESRLYSLSVDVVVEKADRTAAQAEYERVVDAVRKAVVSAGLQVQGTYRTNTFDTSGSVSSGDVFKMGGSVVVLTRTVAEAQAALAAVRATGALGTVTASYTVRDPDAASLVAQKAAIADAKRRAQVIGETVRPKEFGLVYLKLGTLQFTLQEAPAISLQGTAPLPTLPTVNASITVTLFYGFKPEGKPIPKVATKSVKKPGAPPRTVARE